VRLGGPMFSRTKARNLGRRPTLPLGTRPHADAGVRHDHVSGLCTNLYNIGIPMIW
jgi:hypothetical protein